MEKQGLDGVWVEGGRLVLQPEILNRIVVLLGCIGSAPGQLSLECRAPQGLLSTALVWTLATILEHQTNLRHHIVADAPVTILNRIFIVIAEADCTWLFLVAALGKSRR